MGKIEHRWLSVADTAEYLGYAKHSLYNLLSPSNPNKFPFPFKPKRIGRKVVLDKYEIDKYLEDQ